MEQREFTFKSPEEKEHASERVSKEVKEYPESLSKPKKRPPEKDPNRKDDKSRASGEDAEERMYRLRHPEDYDD